MRIHVRCRFYAVGVSTVGLEQNSPPPPSACRLLGLSNAKGAFVFFMFMELFVPETPVPVIMCATMGHEEPFGAGGNRR